MCDAGIGDCGRCSHDYKRQCRNLQPALSLLMIIVLNVLVMLVFYKEAERAKEVPEYSCFLLFLSAVPFIGARILIPLYVGGLFDVLFHWQKPLSFLSRCNRLCFHAEILLGLGVVVIQHQAPEDGLRGVPVTVACVPETKDWLLGT